MTEHSGLVARAFVSYAREDSEFALELAEKLKSDGVALWIDQLDIAPGVRWDREIEAALRASQSVLAILSPAAVESENVLDEISYALEKGKTVVPVICRPCIVPIRLRRLHHLDFTGAAPDLGELIRRLQEIATKAEQAQLSEVLPRPRVADEPESAAASRSLKDRTAISRARLPRVLGSVALLLLLVALLLLWYWAGSATPLSQEEVLQNFRRAMGGEDAWRTINTVVVHGTARGNASGAGLPFTITEVVVPVTVTFKLPSKVRIEMGIAGLLPGRQILVWNGRTAWRVGFGAGEPELLPPWVGSHLVSLLEFETPMMGEKEHVIELLGKELVGETETYKLSVRLRTGHEQLWYVNAETFRPLKSRGRMLLGAPQAEADHFYRDYREVDGVMAYHSLEVVPLGGEPGGFAVTLESIEGNVPVADEIFEMPAALAPEP